MNSTVYLIIIVIFCLLLAAMGFFLWAIWQRQHQLLKRLEEQSTQNKISQEVLVSQNDDRFDFLISQIQSMTNSFGKQDHILDQLTEQTKAMAMTMSNAKMRGSWGEVQMEMLIQACLGSSDTLFKRQVTLDNGKIADGVFFLPGTERLLCIDSKFPLDNFVRMESEKENKKLWEKELVKNVRKHINDIHNKYINEQTEPYALMFIPSEALYQFICSNSDLLQYAWASHVMIVSPTTLSGVLFSLKGATQDFYRAEHMEEIEQSLRLISRKMDAFEELAIKTRRQAQTLNATAASMEKEALSLHEQLIETIEGVNNGSHDS